jgi:hypothetical protein
MSPQKDYSSKLTTRLKPITVITIYVVIYAVFIYRLIEILAAVDLFAVIDHIGSNPQSGNSIDPISIYRL